MMPESRYFPTPAFSLGAHQFNTVNFFRQKQHVIKVEPELSFYNCPDLADSNSNSSSGHEDIEKSSAELNDVQSSTIVNEETVSTSKPKVAQPCKICGKVLSSASSYYVHMKQHSGNKPFHCPICEASFCRKPYLEVHMRTHTGERPFQCSLCLKRFTQKSSLNTHKRVHTGERPYSCDICHKRFAVKSYVSAHRWSHVADKPLSCQHCSLKFTSKTQFAIHLRSHTPSHEYECHLCGRSFVKESFLIRHHYKVHRDMFPPLNEFEDMAYDMRTAGNSSENHESKDTEAIENE
uniref:C2H2-type domain-containing protein n=1 Tax=Clastoptera arizonana TaxID=38151 RepID=A0A1B6CFV4_9HEMI